MFTGIIETTGKIADIEKRSDLARIRIEMPTLAGELATGDSVAVNGTCLTVTQIAGGEVVFDAIAETLAKTALSDLTPGARVNLERAMRAGDRLDGHIVQGHVDGVGVVRELRREGDDVRLFVTCDPDLAQLLVPKGSVAIDGVSLTVVGTSDTGFDVALIPLTLELTTLSDRGAGDRVNLEADVLGKYVKQYLDRIGPVRDGATE